MSLSAQTVEAIVRLISTAVDPGVESSLADRKKVLLEGLANFIGADAWIMAGWRRLGDAEGDFAAVVMDGGWRDEDERTLALGVVVDPQHQPASIAELRQAIGDQQCVTRCRQHLFDDATWGSSPLGNAWRSIGYDELLLSILPLSAEAFNWVSFHRRLGRPMFEEEACIIAGAVFSQLPWLRALQGACTSPDELRILTPRERQVLTLLLAGDSCKQVANHLSLSRYTVSDYVKEIYRKLSVATRSELLAKFISNGRPGDVPNEPWTLRS